MPEVEGLVSQPALRPVVLDGFALETIQVALCNFEELDGDDVGPGGVVPGSVPMCGVSGDHVRCLADVSLAVLEIQDVNTSPASIEDCGYRRGILKRPMLELGREERIGDN